MTAPQVPGPSPLPGTRGRRHRARWVAAVVLVVGAGLVAALATRPPAAATEVDTPLLGHEAPATSGTTLGGQGFDMAALRGRWVVVNFFASWCTPCQQEEPDLVAFAYQHRGPPGVAVVGVVYDDTSANARRFMTGAGATWPALEDPGGSLAVDYGVRAPPETFIVSPAGLVVAHLDGPVTSAQLDHWLAQAQGSAA